MLSKVTLCLFALDFQEGEVVHNALQALHSGFERLCFNMQLITDE